MRNGSVVEGKYDLRRVDREAVVGEIKRKVEMKVVNVEY